ncbi:hypothetical protein IJH46_01415 [Candidatus Saccharibacteria bacterium]|nr:hypothetical protein [Candidatus Saccharibacteria bacterium]
MSKTESNNSEIKNIDAKRAKLNEKLKWFYSEDFSLDKVESKYKEAVTLAKEIEEDLETLKNDIKVLGRDFTR